MFSKEESKKLRQDFWISFGKSFPRKWTLYDTKVKGLSFKFHLDLEKALVMLEITHPNIEKHIALWEKLISLKSILKDDYLPNAIFADSFILKNGKEVSRVYVEKLNVSIHNKNTWRETMEFFNENMLQFEAYYKEYESLLSD